MRTAVMMQQQELKRQRIKSLVEQAGYAEQTPKPLPVYLWVVAGIVAGMAAAGVAALIL